MSPLIMGMVHRRISIDQALIQYTWSADSYSLNASDEVIVENQGSSGATSDLLLYTGEPIEVSATQPFDIPVEATSACVAYYNIVTKAWVYQTTISDPSWTIGLGTFGIIATLDNEPDATDKTRLDAEPWQMLNLWFSETTNLTSIVKADIQHLYNPNSLQGRQLQDLIVDSIVHSTDPFGDSSLLAKYEFENNCDDTLGNNNGTPTNVTYVYGKYGKVADLNGTSSQILTNLQLSGGAFAFHAGISIDSAGTETIMSTGGYTSSNKGLLIRAVASKINVLATNGSSTIISFTGSTTLTLATVDYDLIIMWDGTTGTDAVKLYIDNVLDGSATATGTISGDHTDTMTLGQYNSSNYYAGRLEQVEVYNKALSSLERIDLQEQREHIEVPNYLATMYENADLNKVGVQTTMLDIDATGRVTAMVYDTSEFYANGYGDVQFNPSSDASEWWLEEIIDGVVYQHKYDGTNLNTYTDNVEGGAGAHSPENADYLIGKGVYPKVAADPYTSYTLSWTMWWTGGGYTSYNQSDRYTIMTA